MAEILSAPAMVEALAGLTGWKAAADGRSIARTYQFKDFSAAFGFMTRAALAAEKADHHPDWRNVYTTVEVTLSTHDAGGVKARDIALARAMNALAASG